MSGTTTSTHYHHPSCSPSYAHFQVLILIPDSYPYFSTPIYFFNIFFLNYTLILLFMHLFIHLLVFPTLRQCDCQDYLCLSVLFLLYMLLLRLYVVLEANKRKLVDIIMIIIIIHMMWKN